MSDWLSMTEDEKRLLGKKLLAEIRSEYRPRWAARILNEVASLLRDDCLGFIPQLVSIGEAPESWERARDVFDALRSKRASDRWAESPLDHAVRDLVEVCAKVVNDSSSSPRKFDPHAGARILPLVGQ